MGNSQYGSMVRSVHEMGREYKRIFELLFLTGKTKENGCITLSELQKLENQIWGNAIVREDTQMEELRALILKYFTKDNFKDKIGEMTRKRVESLSPEDFLPKPKQRRRSIINNRNSTGLANPSDGLLKIRKFSEPETTAVGACLTSWTDTIFHPTCACYFIIIIAFISSIVIANTRIGDLQQSKCPERVEKYIWEAKIPNYGEISMVSSNSLNQSVIDKDCIDTTIDNQHSGILYGVIQATMVFMLTMTLSSGLTKYKEEIRLFEALAGDIKAMAMFLVHLTYDAQKYRYDEWGKLTYKPDVEKQYEKIRVILAVITPVARIVLKGKRLKEGLCNWLMRKYETEANVDDLETYKNYIEIPASEPNTFPLRIFCCLDNHSCCGYWKCFYRLGCHCNKNCWCSLENRREKFKWSKYEEYEKHRRFTDGDNDKKLKIFAFPKNKYDELYWMAYIRNIDQHGPTTYEISLYKKIKQIQETSKLDLFETLMTVLLDEIIKISENDLGFGSDEGSAVMSAVYAKWDGIYASWGEMSSIKTYREPVVVHFYRAVMLSIYAVFMPYNYMGKITRSTSLNIMDGMFPVAYFLYIFADIAFFSVMWSIAYSIRNPFKDVRFMRGVKPISSEAQQQVLNLMKAQLIYDTCDYDKGQWWNEDDRVKFPDSIPPPPSGPQQLRRRALNF